MPTCESRAPRLLLRRRHTRSRPCQGTGIARSRIAGCRCRALCSAGSGKDEPFWWKSSAKGFRYENRFFSSLSAIATEVTGTRWNGLAFFGLTA